MSQGSRCLYPPSGRIQRSEGTASPRSAFTARPECRSIKPAGNRLLILPDTYSAPNLAPNFISPELPSRQSPNFLPTTKGRLPPTVVLDASSFGFHGIRFSFKQGIKAAQLSQLLNSIAANIGSCGSHGSWVIPASTIRSAGIIP